MDINLSKTYILGKDSALEDSIESMQNKLKALNFNIEEASWLNPIPNVYSVHIRDKDCPILFTNGKGTTKKSCLASALGEYFERLSCNYFFADFYLGQNFSADKFVHYPNERWFPIDSNNNSIPDGLLDEKLWHYYDPSEELSSDNLIDTNSGASGRGICACPYIRQRDQQAIWFPINIIGNSYVSNGMSAGNTKNEARVQSLSEVFERYVKNKIIAEGLCLPEVPLSVVERYPQVQEAIAKLEQYGYHLRIADASLGGLFPVMSVTLINPKNATVFASFGAHPSFEVALERTVTELLQGRDLNQLDNFLSPSFDMEEIADHHNLETHFIDSSGLIAYDFFKNDADYEFHDWDFSANTHDEYDFLSQLIHDLGFDIYIADYNHLNVYACRIIVPGMSDIYPVEDLLWSNNNEGLLFRDDLLSLKSLNEEQLLSLLDRLEEGGYNDIQTVAEFIGIVPDAGSRWAQLRIGELKAMLCLALNKDEAIEWVSWCINMDQLDQETTRFYLCVQNLLDIKHDPDRLVENYLASFKLMFGEETLSNALEVITAKVKFHGIHSPGLSLSGFDTHDKLLKAYKKLHLAKESNWQSD